ncbi:MAG TPA: hypothetical protein QGF58_18380 [Myxococcota bacterium]|nr:hypothetical protein [Myxococcota bacterium]
MALRGDIEGALRLASAALVEVDAGGATAMRAPVLSGLAAFALEAGDAERARGYLERARELGGSRNTLHRLHLVHALAHVDLAAGSFDAAIEGFRSVATEAAEVGEERLVGDAWEGEAAVLAETRRYAEARILLERAVVSHRRLDRAIEEERATVRAALVDSLSGLPGLTRLDERRVGLDLLGPRQPLGHRHQHGGRDHLLEQRRPGLLRHDAGGG